MKLRVCSKPKRAHATKATIQLEKSNDSLGTVSNETEEPQDHQTEEPQNISFHQPMKLSELAQSYLKHQPARFAAIIHQQQQVIKELRYQNESLKSRFHQQQQMVKELENQKELLMSSLHKEQEVNGMIKSELETVSQSHSLSVQMKDDDEQIHFYTGLPSYIAFTTLLSLLSSVIPLSEQHGGISLSDQLLMVLIKLRQAMTNQDLGYRFHVHLTRVSKIFHLWIDTMVTQLSPLVKWPD